MMSTETPTINNQIIQTIVTQMAEKIHQEKDYLTELDSAIGDADHGVNMDIGFQAVLQQLPQWDLDQMTLKALVKKIGFTLLDKIGGASGPLYGSFFMQLGKDLTDEKTVDLPTFYQMLNNGTAAIEKRGKVALEEKTMFDVLQPTVKYLIDHEAEPDYQQTLTNAQKVAQEAFDHTTTLFPKKGRAARLGEKGVDKADPGSASIKFLINIICDTLKDQK